LHANHGFADGVAVLLANIRVDIEMARQMLGGADMDLASEQDVASRCPNCELSVLPPFGSQYGMRKIVGQSLQQSEYMLFNAHSQDEDPHEVDRFSPPGEPTRGAFRRDLVGAGRAAWTKYRQAHLAFTRRK
jgi:hypothetical protein